MKKYQVLVSQKYLRSRAVNIIAVVAIMLGVAALIIVSSVMNGFAHDIQQRIRGIMSHIVIESEQLVGIGDYEELMRRVEKVPDVEACSPLVDCPFALIRCGQQTWFGKLRGVDLEREAKTSEIESYVARLGTEAEEARKKLDAIQSRPDRDQALRESGIDWGRLQASPPLVKERLDFLYNGGRAPLHPGAIVGIELARRFGGLRPGNKLSVTSATTLLTFQTKDFDVVGGFYCGHYDYDSQLMYVELRTAQDLLGLPGRVTSISVRLHDIDKADQAKVDIQEALKNRTPLLDLADEAARARIKTVSGSYSVRQVDGEWRLALQPPQSSPQGTGEIVIEGIDGILQKADHPTALSFDLHFSSNETSGPFPAFRIAAIDSTGRRFYPSQKDWIPIPTEESIQAPVTHELANFISEDELDLLNPADIKQIAIQVQNGSVELSNLRFEDNRPLTVSTWRDKHRPLLSAVEVERYIQSIIMTLLVVVAGFSIMAILWLMVREKTRDIGILMALGATREGIVRIFLLNGLMIGVIGAGLGLAAGWTISANLNVIEDKLYQWFNWRAFPPNIYYLDKLPHQENPGEFMLMALIAVGISLIAALWPAFKAATLDPIEALRYE